MISPEDYQKARQIRRRHQQERQAVIFGVLTITLAIILVYSIGVYTGAFPAVFDRPFTDASGPKNVSQTPQPCLEGDATPVTSSEIQVGVFNTTGRAGIASAAAQNLEYRGFNIVETGNIPYPVTGQALVTFGINGIDRGYTVAANFKNVRIQLDDREDQRVDVLLGEDYSALVSADDLAITEGQPMTSVPNCASASNLTPVAAPKQNSDLTTDETVEGQ